MKAFLASLLILALLLGVSISEGIYLNHAANEIEKTINQITTGEIDKDEGIRTVTELWKKTDNICKYSVNRKYCHAVSLSLNHLSDSIRTQKEADWQSASRSVTEALRDLRESALSLR